jgi:hypothetical protein
MDDKLIKTVSQFKENVTSDPEELDDWFWTHEGWFHLDGYINHFQSSLMVIQQSS